MRNLRKIIPKTRKNRKAANATYIILRPANKIKRKNIIAEINPET